MKDWSGNKTAVYVTNGDSSHSTRERETAGAISAKPAQQNLRIYEAHKLRIKRRRKVF